MDVDTVIRQRDLEEIGSMVMDHQLINIPLTGQPKVPRGQTRGHGTVRGQPRLIRGQTRGHGMVTAKHLPTQTTRVTGIPSFIVLHFYLNCMN